MSRAFLIGIAAVFLLTTCQQREDHLPILGETRIIEGDTVYHTIRDFSFLNQDSQWVNNETFAGKLYVVDFFFTSCPTICPKVKRQMLRIHDKYAKNENVLLLSHTIDPKRDTVGKLKIYSEALGVLPGKWHFVTGDKMDIYGIAADYFSIAIEDPDAPGGFDHSGRLILVDGQGRIRSFCNGTDEDEVTDFMRDIDVLLNEV
jgi:protein SCO1/2